LGRIAGRAVHQRDKGMVQDLDETQGEGGDEAEGEGEGGPAKKSGAKKLILFIVLPLVLVMGIAAGLYFSGVADPILGMVTGKEPGAAKGEDKPASLQAAVFYDLPDMLVNLNATGRRQAFLKIRVSLELEKATDIPRIEQVMPRIVDKFQVYLRELRLEDLQGAAGVYRLREELLSRVNTAVRPAKVNDVLFKEMLVQ
jgi:flagellar FliL protein